jgi:hypothetical protein
MRASNMMFTMRYSSSVFWLTLSVPVTKTRRSLRQRALRLVGYSPKTYTVDKAMLNNYPPHKKKKSEHECTQLLLVFCTYQLKSYYSDLATSASYDQQHQIP